MSFEILHIKAKRCLSMTYCILYVAISIGISLVVVAGFSFEIST